MLINYQGELRSASTDLLAADGTYDMTFRIYDLESGGTHVWEGRHPDANGNPIEVKNGIFSVLLGSGNDNALDAYHVVFKQDRPRPVKRRGCQTQGAY